MRLRGIALFAPALPAILLVGFAACTGDDPDTSGGGNTPGNDGGEAGTNPTAVTCGPGNTCANNAACVDGYCCDGACGGTCEACNVAGQEGKCTAVKGPPKHGKCDGDATGSCAGSCDGTKRDACTYPDVACGAPPSCAGGTASLAAKCKAGVCPAATSQVCSLGCLEEGCLGVTQVAAGYYHACAVLTDKRVRCWGENDQGQSGQSPIGMPEVKSPDQVSNITGAVMVAATFSTSCALLGDGTVRCWGNNVGGQLGIGTTDNTPHPTPAQVQGVTGATFLSGASAGHFCAIVAGGQIKCWGGNSSGQLGDGTVGANSPVPTTVCKPDVTPCEPATGATFVAGGDTHTCAIFAGGKVACWGSNSTGQLGQPVAVTSAPIGMFVPGGFTATYLTAGNQITCAASGGEAKCFGGGGGQGRLGNGQDTGVITVPTAVCTKQDCSTKLTGVTAVTTFDESSCGLANGGVRCWGSNTGGQLGDGNASASQNYAATQSIAAGVVAISSGGGAHYAVVVDGANRDVRCWGSEGSYQCGTGVDSKNRPTPVSPKW